jgi:hypothetical protein
MTRRKRKPVRKGRKATDFTETSLTNALIDYAKLVAAERAKPTRWRVWATGCAFTEGTRYLLPCVSLAYEGPFVHPNGWGVTLRGEVWKWCGWVTVGKWA